MLTHISIRNFAIIEQWDLELGNHLTVVTGESGAGKSILIDAIELGLGGRGDATQVRQGCDRAEIVLTFEIAKYQKVQSWLQEHDYEYDDECIIRRVLTSEGRSRVSINGTPCTLSQVKALASLLMNIHGQHQNQSLLQKSYQLEVLDYFANHQKVLDVVGGIFQQWQDTTQQLQKLKNHSDNFDAQIELLQYQVSELDELALGEQEYTELDIEQKILANAEQHLLATQSALQQLNNDENSGALNRLHQLLGHLTTVTNDNTHVICAIELINTAIIHLDEGESELQQFVDHFSADPERLAQVESRLETIHTLARKHHTEPKNLYEKHLGLQKELDNYLNASTSVTELEKQQQKLCDEFFSAGKKLTASRKNAAQKLCRQVSDKIQQLGMKGGVFDIVFHQVKDNIPHVFGCETIEFQVSANPGQPLQSLSKVASGGEISRIALAIQVIASQTMVTPSLIFDEVDVGIGGNTAAVVGNILRELGTATQVICITHQPQVAACGHQHVHVQKTISNKTTHTDIGRLDDTRRIEELARMLGGMTVTDKTIANAKELLAAALSSPSRVTPA